MSHGVAKGVFMCDLCRSTVLLYLTYDGAAHLRAHVTYPHTLRTSLSRCMGKISIAPDHIQAAYKFGGPVAVKAILGRAWCVLGEDALEVQDHE